MKVIVAGFPKTGTKSLKSALETLEYGVYDYLENVYLLEKDWDKIFNKGWTTEDFRRMYENVDAVTDAPAFYFWEEIHKAFPDAKIILPIRNEERWFQSLENHLRTQDRSILARTMIHSSPFTRHNIARIASRIGSTILGIDMMPRFRRRKLNKQLCILKYREFNAYVMQNAPKNKLLIFECSQGWDPLCEFLEAPVPNIDFPHENKNGSVVDEITSPLLKKLRREAITNIVLVTAGVAVGCYFLWTRGPTLWNSVQNICNNSNI